MIVKTVVRKTFLELEEELEAVWLAVGAVRTGALRALSRSYVARTLALLSHKVHRYNY